MAQLNTRIVLRNDSAGNWTIADANSDLVLLKGEIGIEYDNNGKVKMKIGDGTTNWTALSYFGGEESKVFQVNSYSELPTENVHIGDTGIVKTLIKDDKFSYTGYVYSETGWTAMDGNYNAENVYFDENIIVTRNVGNVTTSNNIPVEIKTGLLPQDIMVPHGLVLPDNLAGILGDVQIPLVGSAKTSTFVTSALATKE